MVILSFCFVLFFFLQLSFGGMPYSGKPLGGGRKNFKGCMESINYNGDNITDLARRKKLDTSSFVSTQSHCKCQQIFHCPKTLQQIYRQLGPCFTAPSLTSSSLLSLQKTENNCRTV